jgi:hypothetical protein
MVSDVSNESGSADLLTNNLVYEQPKALSLAVNRTYTNQYFQRTDYAGNKSTTAVIDWNTGTSYVNVENSYLTFKIEPIGGDANFGCGSAMNIINEIRIRSRSGTELDRVELANVWSQKDSTFQKPDSYLTTMGSAQGFSIDRSPNDAQTLFVGTPRRFTLPLSVLAPFFRPMKKQLLPPQLASGLRLELVFEDYKTALYQKTGTVTGYTITDIRMVLDTVDLTDDTQRTINMESASEGLEYAYERVYTAVSQVPSNQLQLSMQVRKAVSQACFATAMSFQNSDRTLVTVDSFATLPINYKSYQFRLGSLYFPHQRVEIASGANDASEMYTLAMVTYDKMRHPYASPSLNVAQYAGSQCVLATSFEKDMSLNMSGLPINNSRVLELNLEYTAVEHAIDVVCFLTYCAVSRSYIDNTATAS